MLEGLSTFSETATSRRKGISLFIPRHLRGGHATIAELDVAGSIYSRVMFGMPPGQQIQRLLRQFVDSKIKLYRQRGLKRRGRYNLIANSS